MTALATYVTMPAFILDVATLKSVANAALRRDQSKPLEEEVEIEVEVDNPGCMDMHGLCCFMHVSRK